MKGWVKYLVGAVLAYGICVLLGGRTFSTEFTTAVELGLVMGIFFFVVVGPIHFLLQLIGHFIITRLKRPISRRIETIVLNFPAFAVFITLIVGVAIPMSSAEMRAVFKEHLNNSIPETVVVKGYRMERGMDHGTYIFLFSINKNDLDQLLKSQGYVLQASEEARIRIYKEMAQPFSLNAPITVYLSETNTDTSKFQKNIIVSSNQEDALFIESFH